MSTEAFQDLVIFELANNHQGSVDHGLRIIESLGKAASKHNLRCSVKLQYRDLDSFIHPDFIARQDVKHIPRFLATRLSPDQFFQLVEAIREHDLIPMCTPFDEKSVDMCVTHGIDILKIASCSADDWPLLEKVSETGKPVIVSTGGKTVIDMDNIYNFFSHRDADFAMLHCVGLYPVASAAVQLDVMSRMMLRYHNIPVGYSGHEAPENMDIVKMAIAKGAAILERHVGLATEDCKLNAYSTDAANIESWLDVIVAAKEICGCAKNKIVPDEEILSMSELARGCYAARPIQKGSPIFRDMVYFAMPCDRGQTTSGQLDYYMIASRDYGVNEAIHEAKEKTVFSFTRELIHEIKGMLCEARIVLAPDFQLELSHHYGMEKFREFGTAMIGIVNREYCKKIIVMLPGQKHPSHLHKVKEETFHVLYGVLTIELDGEVMKLCSGEIMVVSRSVMHSFSSDNGCIFEEISTQHVRNDSYYKEQKINDMDPMERKTILEQW